MTVLELLENQWEPSGQSTEEQCKRPVTIIVLYANPAPSDMKILEATPHISLEADDDLLRKIMELQEENVRLQSLSLIDNLTGLYNNRFFWSQLEIELTRTRRTGHPCSIMMIDLDNFKTLNDTLGHLEGDRFLVEFGRIMHDNSRSTDLIYRYGGDEFAIIMPATSAAEAFKTGERIRRRLEDLPQKTDPAISLSIGISEYAQYSSDDINEFVHAADLAMYEAKKGGKNRICIDRRIEEAALMTAEVNPDEKEFLLKKHK